MNQTRFDDQGLKNNDLPTVKPINSLYSDEERQRRDASRWTLVQGVLAPFQFIVFLISVVLVWRYLTTGSGESAATVSVVVKTLVLYAIMITGSIWERDVFGKYLFAPAFFWEDVVSMLVLALHSAYLACVAFGWLSTHQQMYLALTAYTVYVINAAQFLVKFRQAKRSNNSRRESIGAVGAMQ